MQFQYSAKAAAGQATAGVVDAGSLAEARQRLREQGLFVLTLAPQRGAAAEPRRPALRLRRGRVRKADVLMLTSQLSIMCQSGVDLAEALKNAAEQCKRAALKSALDVVYEDVSGGMPVSAALKKHAHIFGEAYVASISAAEASGTMIDVLGRLAHLLRNEIRLRSTLWSALSYPIVLTSVAAIVVAALVFFVLPQFSQVFVDLGTPAPPATRVLMDAANFLRGNLLIILALLGGGAIALWQFSFTPTATRCWDSLLLKGPLLRSATQPLLVGRVFRLMGAMLQSGIPLLEAIHLCRSSVRNQHYHKLFLLFERDVTNGRGIAAALASADFVPGGAVQMVTTAEQTGRLGSVMQAVGEYYEDEGERQVRQLAKLLEPAIIASMGVVVAFVVLSVMLPLLDVSTMPR